jgi:hypothetical protein
METVLEEDGFVVGLAGAEAAVEDTQHLGAEFAVAGGHGIAALFADGEILAFC